MSSFSIDWAASERAAAEASRRNKTIVFEALAKAGITSVGVEFDGEGDQGQMETAVARTAGETVAFPEVTLTVYVSQWGSAELAMQDMKLQDAVEHLCYGYLEEKQGGWEINEGSFGEFALDVEAKSIVLDFYGRIIETEHSSHRF